MTNTERLQAEKSWTLQQFSPWHFRINGIIDVWPKRRKWMHVKTGDKSQQYVDINQLKKIVRQAEEKRAAVVAKIAEPHVKNEPVEPVSKEEFMRLFS